MIMRIVASALFLLLLGCGAPRPHSLQLRLDLSRPVVPTSSKTTFGLLPFEDARTDSEGLGKRIRPDGKEEPFLAAPLTPSSALRDITRQYLEAKGFSVVEFSGWKGEPKGLTELPSGVDIALAGRIDDLRVEARSTLWKTVVRYRVKLTAHFGLRKKKEVLTRTLEVSPEETYLRFDPVKIQDRLNQVIREALERLLEGIPPSS